MTTIAAPDVRTTHRHVFPNGFTLLVREDRSAPVVAIVTRVKAGYFDERDDQVGIAHVLEHMYFKGTPTRGPGEIATATKAAGGWLNAHTIYDATTYITVLPSAAWREGLDIQHDAWASSAIDADELRRELEVIVQEAMRKADTPSAVTVETLYELLHDAHRMRRWRIGRPEPLRGFTDAKLREFYRNWYTPSNTVLAVVGDVDAEAVRAMVAETYASHAARDPMPEPGPHEPARRDARYRALTGEVEQSHVAIGWRTVGPLHPDCAALDVAASLLATGRASRLYREVRERGLATSASAFHYTPTQLGVFALSVVATDDRLEQGVRAGWAALRRLAADGPADDELARVRTVLRARRLHAAETMEGQAEELVAWEALGGQEVGEQYHAAVDAVTADDVRRVLAAWCDPAALACVSYRATGAAPLAADGDALVAWLAGATTDAATIERRAPVAPARVAAPPVLERTEDDVAVFRTAAGIPVLVRRKPGAPVVHLGAFVQGGPCDEAPAQAGVSTLMARAMLKGTMTRTAAQLAEDAESLGGSVSPSVGKELVGWSISVPPDAAGAAAVLLAEVVERPTFPSQAVATERAHLLTELRARRDDMVRHPMALARGALLAGHAYALDTGGTSESVAALDDAALRAWHARLVLAGTPVLAVVGDASPEALAALVAAPFTELRVGAASVVAPVTIAAGVRQVVDARDRKQSALAMLFAGPGRADDDRFALAMLTGIASGLGGRFFESLRSRQSLAYSVSTSATTWRAGGVIASYIACAPEREDEARAGLLREFALLRDDGVTAEELERARRYALGMDALRQESGAAQLADVVDAWLLGAGIGELRAEREGIARVTVGDVQRVAQRWCTGEPRAEGIVRGVPGASA
jgi:zinc protease